LDFNDADAKGNFKLRQFGEKHGFDLERKVGELPIRQLNNIEDKNELLASLKRGNIQSVTFEKNGQKETRFIEANPRAREINVYDANGQHIEDKRIAKDLAVNKPEGNDAAKDQKEGQKEAASQKAGDGGRRRCYWKKSSHNVGAKRFPKEF
jgi:hypothetical protein